jgi:hypothetical protein
VNAQLRRKLTGSGVAAPQPVYTEAQLGSATPPAGWTKGTGAWLDVHNKYLTGKKSEQELAAGGKVGEEQRQQKLVRGGIGLTDYDAEGNKIEFVPNGLDTEVAKLRAKNTGTREMVALLNEAEAVRTGWTSDVVGSDENKKLKVIMGKLKLAAKDTEDLGAITESDADLIKGLIGTDDFTEWRSISAAIDQAKRGLVQSLRIKAQGLGMSARAAGEINFANPYANKAKESQEDAAFRSVLNDKADEKTGDQIMGQIYALATTSPDPKVREANWAKLQQLAKDAPNELTRRSVKAWIGDAKGPPAIKPKIVSNDDRGNSTVALPDGTKKVMPTWQAWELVKGQ